MPQTATDTQKPDIDIYSEDVVTIGKAIYERDVLPHVTPEDKGKMVVIDVYSGDYEIDRDSIAAGLRLKRRHPDAFFYIGRVGYRSAYRMGLRIVERHPPAPPQSVI